MRKLYQARRVALVHALAQHVPALVPHNADAGLHISAFLPDHVDDVALSRSAALRGVDVTPLSTCYAGRHPRSGLILGFGGASERKIAAASRILGEVMQESAAAPT
jgi:GntR family transcriptional regulator/MocR family aminotransferase